MIPSPWYDPKLYSYVLCESISMVPFIWHDSNDMWKKEILAVLQIGWVMEGSGWHRGLINYMKDRILTKLEELYLNKDAQQPLKLELLHGCHLMQATSAWTILL